MYRVLCDSFLLYDDSLEEYKIFSPKVDLELNKTGSFTFTIYPDHPTYEFIRKMKSIITVYQDDFLLFRGRVLNDEIGFYNEKYVECEGEMAFLIDSVIRPYEFTGSITEFLQKLISEHNAQVDADRQFTLGNVTVTDAGETVSMTSNDYKKTWEVITESLINKYGGYVDIRRQENISYIDFLNDFTLLSAQKIEFAKNLLEMKRIRKGDEISTALIPLGAKLEGSEERLTIESVNDGLDYIFDEDAVKEYGMIFATNIWDDVTIASNLLRKAKAHLASLVNTPEIIELSAADLAAIDKTVTSFHVGTYVNVTSNPHGINQNLLVRKLSIDLLEPAANKLVLGGIVESFTAKTVSAFNVTVRDGKDGKDAAKAAYNKAVNAETAANDAASSADRNASDIVELASNAFTEIAKSQDSVLSTVSEQYYLKQDAERLVSEVSTQIEQTNEDVVIRFNQFNAELEGIVNGTDAEFEQIKKYIRFIDGRIHLGEIGNELELQIRNDRISFIQNGAEVAYLSNNKLYVVDGEFTNSLRLGNFAFTPRANGNLSFKKVGV